MILSLIVFLPLAGAILVLLAGGSGDRPDRERLVRTLALGVSLLLSLSSTGFQWSPTSSIVRPASRSGIHASS